MIEAVSIAGLCLLALGLADTRARLMALILALAWLETALFDLMATVDMAIAMRPLIDFCAGVMALGVVTKDRWSITVPAVFAVMLLCHGAYWMAWRNGVDLWYAYPHALNALWLLQLAAVAWPSGGKLVGLVGSWIGGIVHDRSRAFGSAVGSRRFSSANLSPYESACSALRRWNPFDGKANSARVVSNRSDAR